MSFSNQNEAHRAISDAIQAHWVVFLVQGVIMMILGGSAIIQPQISTIAVDLYAGWMFLLSGIVGLVTMFIAPHVSAFLWSLLTAALSLFVGVLLIWHPVEGAASLTLVLVAFFFVEGIFQIAAAIRSRDMFPDTWAWMLISGIADLGLAAIIISGWPGAAQWVLGLMAGVNLISSGLAIAMVAIGGRSVVRALESATR